MPPSKKAGPGRKQKASSQIVSPDKQKPCKACRAQKVKCTHNSQLRRSERRTDPRDLGERRVSSSNNAQKDSPAMQAPVHNDPALEHFNLILRRLDGIDNNVTSLADRVTIGQIRINNITSNNDDAWVNTPEYLLELLEKINHNDWPVVRAAHRTVLHTIEHGHVNPTDATKLCGIRDNALRQLHQRRPHQGQHSQGGNHSNNHNHAMFYDPNSSIGGTRHI